MNRDEVVEVLKQKGYSDVPDETVEDFIAYLNKYPDFDETNPKKSAKNLSKAKNNKQTKTKTAAKKQTKKSTTNPKKQQSMIPKNLCNFTDEDDVTKFSNEMKRLRQDEKELLNKFQGAINFFSGVQQ